MKDFINDEKIQLVLDSSAKPEKRRVEEVISKARELNGLTAEETAILLQTEDKDLVQEILMTARFVKESIYGNRLVLFAPLYIANHCANNCLYCGFRHANKGLKRVALTKEEIAAEAQAIEAEGHKRILMLCGEHPTRSSLDYFIEAIETVYTTTNFNGEIRRINVEVAPLEVDEFKRLKAAKIGTYLLFQETYHHATYREMHPSGPKRDYEYRLTAMHRAQEAGIDDVGMGALFGLYDYKFEVLGLLYHAQHLEKTCGVGPHTISIPRLEPALNAPAAIKPPHPVSDDDFKKLVAILRLAVPYTGMILTTRETAALRNEIFSLGVSQISAGSRTNPGGYHDHGGNDFMAAQFNLGDTRSLDEVIYEIVQQGLVPSFCTACYRLGRTGADFMDLAKPGLIKKFCRTNAIFTFEEYLLDYASKKTKKTGMKLMEKLLADTEGAGLKSTISSRIKRMENGERDLYI